MCAVPWFFMLSGYVLTHAQLSRKDPSQTDPLSVFFRKRLAAIYPLYAVGLVLSEGFLMAASNTVPKWYVLLSQATLTQSWVPWVTEKTIQLHCWFLSAMIPYWALFGILIRRVVLRIGTLHMAVGVLLLLASPPWLSLILPEVYRPQSEYGEWYADHRTGSLATWKDVLVVFLKFHPFCYFHVFLFGMVLARLRDRLKLALLVHGRIAQQSQEMREISLRPSAAVLRLQYVVHFLLLWGSSLGYLLLGCVFLISDIRPYSAKISARLTILMVPQGLILLGLSPLPTLSASSPLAKKKTSPTDAPPSPPASPPDEQAKPGEAELSTGTMPTASYAELSHAAEEGDVLVVVSSTQAVRLQRGSSAQPPPPALVVRGLSALHELGSSFVMSDEERAAKDVRWVRNWDLEDLFASGTSFRVDRAAEAERQGSGQIVPVQSSATQSASSPRAASNTTAIADIKYAKAAANAVEKASAASPPRAPRLRPSWRQLLTTDPVARLFAFAPAAWGNVSYGQYILHMIVYKVCAHTHAMPAYTLANALLKVVRFCDPRFGQLQRWASR